MRHLLLLALCLLASRSSAAELRLHGEVTDVNTRTPFGEVLVRVYKDGVKQQVFTTSAEGHYNVHLDNEAEYVIRFSAPGRVTKCFAVDTHGGEWAGDNRSVDLAVEMTLFERVDGVDLSFFDLPMGIARFSPMSGFLSWDKAYEEEVQAEVSRLMAEVALRRAAVNEQAMNPEVGTASRQ
ncbi:MAG: hypothetical protein ABI432_10025 [Flavobacteriales bacterium]